MTGSPKGAPEVPSRRLPAGFGTTVAASKTQGVRLARPEDYVWPRVVAIAEAFSAHFAGDIPNVTMAVGVADDFEGHSHKLISANEGNYMRADVRLLAPPQRDEIVVDSFHHAELNIVSFVMAMDWKLRSLASTRAVWPACRAAVGSYGVHPMSTEKPAPVAAPVLEPTVEAKSKDAPEPAAAEVVGGEAKEQEG